MSSFSSSHDRSRIPRPLSRSVAVTATAWLLVAVTAPTTWDSSPKVGISPTPGTSILERMTGPGMQAPTTWYSDRGSRANDWVRSRTADVLPTTRTRVMQRPCFSRTRRITRRAT